jgi:hypothetical protein
MLGLAAVLRGIFLGRNFASRIPSRGSIIYFVIAGAEALYFFMVSGSFFQVPTDAQIAHGATVAHFLTRHY